MPDPSPTDHEMLLRALRFYSDHCEPGELHRDCPYSVMTSSGLGCGNECLDYLGQSEAEVGPTGVEIAIGISAKPLRPRRHRPGPGINEPAFDCGQVYVQERELSPERQSPIALLRGLLELLTGPPATNPEDYLKRVEEGRKRWAALDAQGFDVASVVADAISPQMASTLCSLVLLRLIASPDLHDQIPDPDVYGWTELLIHSDEPIDTVASRLQESGPDARASVVAGLLGADRFRVQRWLGNCSFDDALQWKPPTIEEFETLSPKDPSLPRSTARWALDRFTETYLDKWGSDSLELEWMYSQGSHSGVCSPQSMNTRRVDKNQLAATIADRRINNRAATSQNRIVSKYVDSAVEFLEKGDRHRAVSLFDIACELSPFSADAFNNRGFCRLMDEPDLAVKDFETARNLGPSDPFLTAANLSLALYRSNRSAIALKVAEDNWGKDSRLPIPAAVWDLNTEAPTLAKCDDTVLYLAQVAMKVATDSGDTPAATEWRLRAEARAAELNDMKRPRR